MQYLTIAEAAEAAEVTEGTFKSRLNRALKVLRKQIGSENGELQ
jgi:DNA-directed RNA polymerase specialized sigma24 family protein